MPKEKRPVYAGYEERYMTGQEIIDTFSNAYECFGHHHERTTAYKMDWSYKPRVKPEKTYRVFVNDNFCGIFDNETDAKLYFFGYTMVPPPWAKEGKRPPKPKLKNCTAYIDKTVYCYVDGETREEIEKEPFQVICDENEEIITDLKLLKILYDMRFAKRFPVMITDKALVSLATYKPLSKEEFVALAGLGEGTYRVCGEEFINVIKSYIDCTNSNLWAEESQEE